MWLTEMPHRRLKNAGKRANQGRTDKAAQQLGRLIERPHRLDNPKHRRNDTERRQRLCHQMCGACPVGGGRCDD